jgi:hypothetical protein
VVSTIPDLTKKISVAVSPFFITAHNASIPGAESSVSTGSRAVELDASHTTRDGLAGLECGGSPISPFLYEASVILLKIADCASTLRSSKIVMSMSTLDAAFFLRTYRQGWQQQE